MHSYEQSPARKKRYAKRLRREEVEWAKKSGPVEVTYKKVDKSNEK